MARKRATGRFYFLLILLLAVIAYLLYQNMPRRVTQGVVGSGFSTDNQTVDVVIIRDELVSSYEGLERVEYIAAEGAQVSIGTPIADIYTTSYIQKELNKLSATRESIRAYHLTLLDESTDSSLDRLGENVALKARELKSLVSGRASGNLSILEDDLRSTMAARQAYLKQNRLEDTKLQQLYADEEKRESSITSWKTNATADRAGIVSFYFDGYETVLTKDTFASVSAEMLHKIMNGDPSVMAQKSKRSEQVYRIVASDEWYVCLLSRDTSWSPVNGQELSFQMDGFEDITYTGTVAGVQRSGSEVIIQLAINEPIGPLVSQRAGSAKVGIHITGLSVPIRALTLQNGQYGVWVQGSYGITSFVQVNVLSQDRSKGLALVQPMQSDALYEGMTVMIY